MTMKDAENALRKKKLDEAMDECLNTMFLLTIERVHDPLVEVNNIAKLVSTVVKVNIS